jgi:PAS domain S-box-containing protein
MSAAAESVESVIRHEEHFLQLMKDAPVAFAILQRPDRLNAFNPAFERMLDLTSIRKPVLLPDLLPTQNRKEVEELLSELFRGERERFQFEARSCRSEGQRMRWTAWSWNVSEKRQEYALLSVEDLSGIALVEQRLRQAERLETVGRLGRRRGARFQ